MMLLLMLAAGVNCAWADETVGATNNSTGYAGAYSTEYTISTNQKLHLEFTNYTSGDENWHNWLLFLRGIGSGDYVLRADAWWFCGDYNPNNTTGSNYSSFSSDIDWDNFLTDMNGAQVSMDVNAIASAFVVVKVSATNNGRTYTETLKLTHGSGDIKAKLSVDHSHLVITKAEKTNCSVSYYDFASMGGTLDSRFEGIGGGTGSWYFNSNGYYNGTSGTRLFHIKELYNGDQVVVTYSGNTINFETANAKNNTGTRLSKGSSLRSDESFYVTADGTVTLNVPRYVTIQSVEIVRETNLSPAITLSSTNQTLTVGQTYQTIVSSTTPTHATPTFTSSNTSVAIVDADGKVTAVGAGNEPATITATVTVNGSSQSASYQVSVNSATTTTETYDFQNFTTATGEQKLDIPSDGNVEILGVDVTKFNFSSFNFTTGYEKHPVTGKFGVATSGWKLRKSSGSDNPVYGLFNETRKRDNLYLLDMQNGDKVTITYYHASNLASTATTTNLSKYNSSTQKYVAVASGEAITSGTEYTVTSDGYVMIGVRENTHIQRIVIKREGSPNLSFSPTSTTYELTETEFTEPTLITQPNGIGVTYSSSDETIAKTGGNGGPQDIMFIKPGTVTITATAIIGGVTHTASYTVLVKASDALFTMSNETTGVFAENNPYSGLENTGVLATPVITTVPFMKMTFGNGSNTVVVKNINDVRSSMILDQDGWQNMSYTVTADNKILPTAGTFYKFEPALGGNLTIRGVKRNGRNNSVVLVDASATSGTTTAYHAYSGTTYDVTFSPAKGTTYTSGQSEDVKSGETTIATITFGETKPAGYSGNDYKDFSFNADNTLSGYSASTVGNGTNGNKQGGTFYTIVPKFDGQIEIAVILNDDKAFYILENGIPLSDYNGIKVTTKYYGTYTFNAKANKEYKIYCSGSKLGFYGFKFTNDIVYTSYPIRKTYSFSGNNVTEEPIRLEGGHTYYLYGNTGESNGGDWQTFYLHGFTYTTDFYFASKGIVMDGKPNATDAHGYIHVPIAETFTATAESGSSYSLLYKDKDGKTATTTATINASTGEISGIKDAGSYVVTASITFNGKTYKTYYVLTVPYSLEATSKEKISWKFNGSGAIEDNEALNDNADEWSVFYKVRTYDTSTGALTYINVPVRTNGITMVGDNARYFDNTAGLLFKAQANDFGTTANDLDATKTLKEKLESQPTELVNYKYITMFNGSSMTIPNLKAGQYVRVKWSRYSKNNGDQITATNVTDLNGKDMNGKSFSVGAGGRVSDNGGTGYHEFKVKADGDVTFTVSQDGWVNIYEVDVANQFIPTDLRLQTVDATASGGSSPSDLAFIRRKSSGTDGNISNEYATVYGRVLSQSDASISYHIKGTTTSTLEPQDTRTGTLTKENCTITGTTLNVSAGGHGRFTLVQEGTVDGSYLLDRNEYEIKVYEYDYTPKTYPYTWNLMHVTTETGNTTVKNLTTDATITNNTTAHQYKYWAANNGNTEFTMDLSNPENLMDWNYKTAINGTPVAIPELAGLGIHPQDLGDVANNSIVFKAGNGGQGVVLSSTAETPKPQILTVPSVLSGQTAYLAVSGDGTVSVGDVVQTPARTVDGNKIYEVAGSGGDIEFAITNMTVQQVAVSVDTKTVYGAGYATEARSYPLDFTLAQTLLGREQKAYIVTGANNGKVVVKEVKYIPANNGVMITGTAGSTTSWPLFTTDVNRDGSDMTGNMLVGVVDNSTINGIVDWKTGSSYNYVLAAGGWVIDYETSDFETTTGTKIGEVSGVGFYLVTKSGTKIDGTPYTGDKPNSHSAYLQLPALYATHQGVETERPSDVRQFFFIDFGDEATAIKAVGTNVPADARIPDNSFYTLQGVRVDNPGKGVYIHNGKMIVIK